MTDLLTVPPPAEAAPTGNRNPTDNRAKGKQPESAYVCLDRPRPCAGCRQEFGLIGYGASGRVLCYGCEKARRGL